MEKKIQLIIKADDTDIKKTEDSMRRLNKAVSDTSQSGDELESLFTKADLKARAIVAATDAFRASFDEFRNFGKEISNLNTLLDDNTSIETFRTGLLNLNPNLGQTSELAKGMYQAISSGVDSGEALEFVEKSAKAARAGLASTFETVDAGTSVMASFGLKGKDIGMVYDKMFEVVKRGKVEMPQLASSIGMVTNIAAQTGVTLDEMFGAIATSSRTVNASQAIEGFRSALSNILKPSDEAAKLAESLGIQFDVSALKSKGFAQFLGDVMKATQGNQQQLATLFGDVQALGFIMSITGNQAGQLSQDLNGVSKASGTVEEAFQKQQQSLDAQINTFYNSIVQGLTKAFMVVEPIATGFLKILNQYPGTVAIAATAIGTIAVAYNAVGVAAGLSGAVQAISAFGSSLGGTVFVIQNVLRAMVGLQTAFITTAETAVAATAGWAAVGLVIGGIIYAIYQYNQAQQKTVEEHIKGIEAVHGQIQVLNEQKQTLNSLQGDVTNLSDKQEKLSGIYQTLSADSLQRVNAATKEKGAVNALAEEIERLNRAKGLELEVKLIEIADKTAKAFEKQRQAVKEAKDANQTYESSVGKLNTQMLINSKTGQATGIVVKTVKEQYDQLGQRQAQTTDEAQKTAREYTDLKNVLEIGARQVGMTTLEFIQAKVATGQLNKQTAEFLQDLANVGPAQTEAANKTDQTTNTVNNQTIAIGKLRDQLKGLVSDMQTRVDDKIADLAMFAYKQGLNNAQIADLGRTLLKYDDQLRNDLKGIKFLNDGQKILRETIQPSEKTSARSTATRSIKSAEKSGITERLPAFGEGFRTYRREFNQQYGKQDVVANLMTVAANWAQVSNIPIQIGDLAKKGGIGTKGHESHYKGDSADVRPFRKDGKMDRITWNIPGTDKVNPLYDRDRMREFLKVVKETKPDSKVLFNDPVLIKEGLAQKWAGHNDHAHLGRLGGSSARGGDDFAQRLVESEDRRLSALSDIKTEEAMVARVNDAIKGFDEVKIPDKRFESKELIPANAFSITGRINEEDYQEYVAYQQELARKTGEAVPLERDIRREVESRGRIVKSGEGVGITQLEVQKTYLENLRESLNLEEREGQYLLRKVKKETEIAAMQEDYELSLKESQLDLEIEHRLLLQRNLEMEASVEFGKQQNQQYRDLQDIQVDLNVLRQQNSDSQFVEQRRFLASKREQFDLEKDIASITDEIANIGINDGLKIQAAHLRDILDLRSRELDAVISINRSQLEIANSMQVSNNQIRASVYEHLAQQKSLNESIADGINQTYDAVLNKLNENLDKLNEKTKGFLAFLIEPVKALQQNTLTNLTTSIFDALFPPEIADQFKATGNPLLDESKKQTRSLKNIEDVLTGNSLSASSHSIGSIISGAKTGGFSGIIKAALKLGGSGGSSTGGVDESFIHAFYHSDPLAANLLPEMMSLVGTGKGGAITTADANRFVFGTSSGSGSIWSNLNTTLFGKKGFGWNAGTTAGLGSIAQLLGSLIGGRTGSVLSMAGTGAQIGSMFGPIGGAVGAGIGALVGLFTGGTRKQDEQARTQAKSAILSEFDQIIAQLNAHPPQINPPSGAAAQADQLIAQYTTAMNQLKDSKTRRIAMDELKPTEAIGYKRSLINTAIQAAVKWQADDLNRQQIAKDFAGEFASGVYMDTGFKSQYGAFKRRNGILPGTWTGKDTLPSLLAMGEMVLNPSQIARIRKNAGYDVFEGAGIPNYQASLSPAAPKFAGGVNLSSSVSSASSKNNRDAEPDTLNFEFHIDGLQELVDVQIRSEKNRKYSVGSTKTYVNRKGRNSD